MNRTLASSSFGFLVLDCTGDNDVSAGHPIGWGPNAVQIVSVILYQSISLIEIDVFELVDGLTCTWPWLLSTKHLGDGTPRQYSCPQKLGS